VRQGDAARAVGEGDIDDHDDRDDQEYEQEGGDRERDRRLRPGEGGGPRGAQRRKPGSECLHREVRE